MNISKFLRLSLGQWRSQRTGHTWDTCEIEDLNCTLEITNLTLDHPEVIRVCQQCDIEPQTATLPFQVTWFNPQRGTIDPDNQSIFVPIPQPDNANLGKILQSHRNNSSPVDIGRYHLNAEGTFILTTEHPGLTTEERTWFATPNLRLQVLATIPQNAGGRATTTFITENRIIQAPVV